MSFAVAFVTGVPLRSSWNVTGIVLPMLALREPPPERSSDEPRDQ
jgi:hypothetical protein